MVSKRLFLVLACSLLPGLLVNCGGGGGGSGGVASASLVEPSGAEIWSGTRTIRWNSNGSSTVEIRLSTDGGVTFPNIVTSAAPNNGSYEWDTSRFPDGLKYRIQIRTRNNKGILGTPISSAQDFSLDNTAPVVVLSSPTNGSVWFGQQVIEWSTADAHVGTVEIRLAANGGNRFPIAVADGVVDGGLFEFDSSSVADGETYRVQVIATDKAGNESAPAINNGTFAIINGAAVQSPARYLDMNFNGVVDQSDELVIPFNTSITVNGVRESDFALPVSGNGLGDSPAFAAGPANNEITITLGTNPTIKTRQSFESSALNGNASSGIDLSESIRANVIENTVTGGDAQATSPVDIAPGFVPLPSGFGNYQTNAIAAGDFDRNGTLDLITAHGSNQPNRLWLNSGNGAMVDSGQALGSSDSRGVFVADFNRDGSLDVVFANGSGQNNTVFLNDGSGVLTWTGESLGIADSRAVAAGDLDGDGDWDLVFGNELSGNTVYFNDGSGSFTSSGQNLANRATRAIILLDVDSDDDLDLAVGNYAQGNRLYLNDGSGQFTDSGQSLGTGETHAIVAGDVDGDGDVDLVFGNRGANRVWLNNGNGVYTVTSERLGDLDTRALALNDFDLDGDLDLIEGAFGVDGVIRLNDSLGRFSSSMQGIGKGATSSIIVGDFDKDGDDDIAQGRSVLGDRLWMNSLAGGWGVIDFKDSGQRLGNNTDYSYGEAIGDLDNDGDLDLVVARFENFDEVWLNNGQGVFVDSGQRLGRFDEGTWGVELGDVDGDGDLDLFQSGVIPRIFRNDGTGVFSDTRQDLGDEYAFDGLLFDADHDGDLDLMIATDSANSFWFNVGNGVFANSNQTYGAQSTSSLESGDIDGDGDLDVIAGNRQATFVWRNDGAGGFSDSGQRLASDTEYEYGTRLCDLDNDGDLDLALSVYFVETGMGLMIYRNDGAGIFTLIESKELVQCLGLSVGDFDGDGDIDLCIGRYNGQPNLVFVNDGNGLFSDAGYRLGNRYSAAILFGDFDRDGDLDIVDGSFDSNNLFWND